MTVFASDSVRVSTRTTLLAGVTVLALFGLGCSSDGGSDSDGSGGTTASGGSGGSGGSAAGGSAGSTSGGSGGTAGSSMGGSGGTGGVAPQCDEGPGYEQDWPKLTVDRLDGTVVDETGAAAVDTAAQVCGTDICIFGRTNDNGDVVTCMMDICTPGILPQQEIKKPAFKYGGGINYARFAFLLETDAVFDVGSVATIKLDPPGSGVEMAPGGSVSHGGVTLTLEAGTAIDIDILTFTDASEQQFRGNVVQTSAATFPAVDDSLGLELLVATTPTETHFCPHAQLTIDNTQGWEAGAEVEFWIHGIDITEEWAPYGGWAKISDGAVSSDGATVSTNEGEGIPALSVFGVRLKP